MVPALNLSAELRRQKHLAIANSENRNTGLKNDLRRPGAALFGRRCGPTRQDYRLGLHPGKSLGCLLEGNYFRVNPHLAHPPGNELGNLGTEIDNENLIMHGEPLREPAGVCKMALSRPPNPKSAWHSAQ